MLHICACLSSKSLISNRLKVVFLFRADSLSSTSYAARDRIRIGPSGQLERDDWQLIKLHPAVFLLRPFQSLPINVA